MPDVPSKFTLESPGATVRLHVDTEDESYYIEIDHDCDPRDREAIGHVLDALHLEEMDEEECPHAMTDDEAVIIWCASTDGVPL